MDRPSRFNTVRYGDIKVSFRWRLNGGGIVMAHEFVRLVERRIGRVEHVFEYCAGPGFIGFALLAHGMCERLTLADVNPEAVEAARETVRQNRLEDRVSVYQSDCLDAIPEHERWDLIVGNPPWWLIHGAPVDIRVQDPEGRVHRALFQDAGKFLKPNGSILLIEGGEYTRVRHFADMVQRANWRIVESFSAVPFFRLAADLRAYRGVRMPLAFLVRLGMFLRRAYFIWIKR